MIRIITKLFAITVVLTAFLHIAPLFAASVTYVSNTGNTTNPCTVALPCSTIYAAYVALTVEGGQVTCLNSNGITDGGNGFETSITINCAGVFELFASEAFQIFGSNQVVKIRNLTVSGATGGVSAIKVTGSGTLIIENCVFENLTGAALDIEPSGAFNLVVTDSRISNNAAGVLIKPTGSVTATFNGVTIVGNTGGGLKTDATNGPVSVDISNSTISNNGSNGMNAVGGGIYSNMLNLSHNVIAKNGGAGIQANGALAAAVVDTTLLDTNVAGATAAINGGRALTYGNNRTVGSPGSGFTGTAPLN